MVAAVDAADFDGLALRTVLVGVQLLGRTGEGRGAHVGAGFGGSIGLTGSKSFHDSAAHVAGEVAATALVGLGRLAPEHDVSGCVREP